MSEKIVCTTCDGDPVDPKTGNICPTCDGECMIDSEPPKVQDSSTERPGYFRGARISNSKSQSAKGKGK